VTCLRRICLAGVLLLLWAAPALAAPPTFSDLGGVPWARTGVTVLAAEGVTQGVAAAHFGPSLPISREMLAVLIARLFALSPGGPLAFRDAGAVDAWARPGVAAAVAAGILRGEGGGRLDPRGAVTRAEAATMLARAFGATSSAAPVAFRDADQMPPWAVGAVAALSAPGVLAGFPDGTFRPSAPLTRAEMAVILARAEALLPTRIPLANVVTGKVTAVAYPDDPGLVDESTLAGPGGGVALGSHPLLPIDPAALVAVGPNGAAADIFALAQGDPAVAVVGPNGEAQAVWDVASPASPPALADASSTRIYLSDGTTVPIDASTVFAFGDTRLPIGAAAALLGSTVTGTAGDTVTLGTVAFTGLTGTVLAIGAGTLTVAVADDPTGLIGTGARTFATTGATAVLPVGGAPAAALAAGDTVTLFGTLSPGGTPTLTRVLYAP
jgi:hypothetical protein